MNSAVRLLRNRFGRQRGARHAALTIVLVLALTVLVILPLGFLLFASLKPTGFISDAGFTIEHYLNVYGDPNTYQLVATSIVFSTGSTAVALAVGVALAWIIERTDVPARRVLRAMVLIPMALPPLLLGIGWILLLSPEIGAVNRFLIDIVGFESPPLNIYSLPGMILVQALSLVPSTYLILAPAFRNMDPALEEAASTSGAGTMYAVRRIFLPVLLPAILAAAALTWIVGLLVFDIPGIIGLPADIQVFSSAVYFGTHPPAGFPNYGRVAALASLFLVVTLVVSAIYLRATRDSSRFTTISGKGYRPRPMALGRTRIVALGIVLTYFTLSVLAPVAMLVWQSIAPYYSTFLSLPFDSLTLGNFDFVLRQPGVLGAAWNTAVVAVLAAVVVVVLSTAISWAVVRLRVPGHRAIDTLAFLPIAIPAIMTALALSLVYLSLRFIPIYGTIWIIVLAYATIYLAFGSRTMNGVFVQISPDLEEASQLSGASPLLTLRRITVPLIFPSLLIVGIWVAAHAARDLAVPLMLQSTENDMFATLIWSFWQTGEGPATAAIGVLLTVGLLVLISVWQYLEHVRERGRSY